MNNTNITIFKQTIDAFTNGPYAADTKELCANGTTVYDCLVEAINFDKRKTNIEVVAGDTIETGKSFVSPDKVTAVLNFADALSPGGLVWSGASTQEEHLCRCSNLFASLTTKEAMELYYQANVKAVKRVRKNLYTDNIIYSKDVLFFRNAKDYRFLETPYKMDVITCPAPSAKLNAGDARMIISSRAECIIQAAVINGVDNLILGAWGCGAFGQSPEIVASCFKNALKDYPAFDNVIFAIKSCKADRNTKTTNNYDVFKEILG